MTNSKNTIGKNMKRLRTEHGISQSMSKGGEFTHLDGGQFNVAPNSKATTIGSQVAQSVYKNVSFSQSSQEC